VKEKGILLEVQNDGDEIVLLDGRKVKVNSGDIPTACVWLPTVELKIINENSEGTLSVIICNISNNEEVKAVWL